MDKHLFEFVRKKKEITPHFKFTGFFLFLFFIQKIQVTLSEHVNSDFRHETHSY